MRSALLIAALAPLVWLLPLARHVGAQETELDTPRHAVTRFLELGRAGDSGAAAALLDPGAAGERAPQLAHRLKLVLDRHAWIDLAALSDHPEGDREDGLDPDVERIATVPRASGARDDVLLRCGGPQDAPTWRFSARSVARIDAWFGELPNAWLLDRLPPALLVPGPLELMRWQWLALPIVVLCAWILGRLLSSICLAIAGRVARRTSTRWDDELLPRLSGPLRWFALLLVVRAVLPWLDLVAPAEAGAVRLIRASGFALGFWAMLRAIDVACAAAAASAWARTASSARTLVPLARRVAKVLLTGLALVVFLSELGYPVASLVAGFGLGGLAFALAAQKTVENLFGAFSIGVDQPFREGDFVRVEEFVATVESIGLRSTRFRTLDRTIVTIPNGRLADMRLETYSARDRMRLSCTLGLVYSTTAEQMREVLSGLERALRAHPKIWPDAVVVRFKEFAASSLDIEIMAWFQTPEWSEFQLIRQEVLLQFMGVVEAAGSSFAFPTRTLHVEVDRLPRPSDN